MSERIEFKTVTKEVKYYICDFCGLEKEKINEMRRCQICKKTFCSSCGTHHFELGNYGDYPMYLCNKHFKIQKKFEIEEIKLEAKQEKEWEKLHNGFFSNDKE